MRAEIERRICQVCNKEEDFNKKMIGATGFRTWIETKISEDVMRKLHSSGEFGNNIIYSPIDFCCIKCFLEFADKIKKLYRIGKIG